MENYSEDMAAIAEATAKFTETSAKVVTEAPEPTDVDLPGGLVDSEGILIKYAVVKELNGADEEAIAKSGSVARSLNTILRRGLVSIGGREPNEDDFKLLLSGDRDALLLAIRRVTFGDTVGYDVVCPGCIKKQEIEVDLTKDIKVTILEDPILDRTFEVALKKGVARVKLPNMVVQSKLLDDQIKTNPEAITTLLAGCLLSVDSSPSIGAHTALMMSSGDRQKVVEEILKRNPGPRLGEVDKACEACGAELLLPLSLADLFRI
jgi:hypothetical protein